jgi:hypothetical protein
MTCFPGLPGKEAQSKASGQERTKLYILGRSIFLLLSLLSWQSREARQTKAERRSRGRAGENPQKGGSNEGLKKVVVHENGYCMMW